jgi:3-isopropylmalate dehydrogenase
MATHSLFLLPGDGIGTEIMVEVEKLIAWTNAEQLTDFSTDSGLAGGSAYDKHQVAITDEDTEKAKAADAVIFGAVGGPKWDNVPYEHRPEAALLRLRKEMAVFANLRPAICYPALADASSLKRELVEGLDILIVRELTGGVYFGEPRSAPSIPRSMRPTKSTASPALPSISHAPATTRCIRPTRKTS